MQVIINLPKTSKSFYKNLNGKTFSVAEYGTNFVSVIGANPEFPENKTDFYLNEFLIVSIEVQFTSTKDWLRYYKDRNIFSKEIMDKKQAKMRFLENYIEKNKIKLNPHGS